jgi:hypothetical protein
VIVTVRLLITGPRIDESRRLDYEKEDYFCFRWWPAPEVLSSSERFYPSQLPALLVLSSAKKSMNRSNLVIIPNPSARASVRRHATRSAKRKVFNPQVLTVARSHPRSSCVVVSVGPGRHNPSLCL